MHSLSYHFDIVFVLQTHPVLVFCIIRTHLQWMLFEPQCHKVSRKALFVKMTKSKCSAIWGKFRKVSKTFYTCRCSCFHRIHTSQRTLLNTFRCNKIRWTAAKIQRLKLAAFAFDRKRQKSANLKSNISRTKRATRMRFSGHVDNRFVLQTH